MNSSNKIQSKTPSIGGGRVESKKSVELTPYMADENDEKPIDVIETPKFIQWITHGSGLYYPEFNVQI